LKGGGHMIKNENIFRFSPPGVGGGQKTNRENPDDVGRDNPRQDMDQDTPTVVVVRKGGNGPTTSVVENVGDTPRTGLK